MADTEFDSYAYLGTVRLNDRAIVRRGGGWGRVDPLLFGDTVRVEQSAAAAAAFFGWQNASDVGRGGVLIAQGASGSGYALVASNSSGYHLDFGIDNSSRMRLSVSGYFAPTASGGLSLGEPGGKWSTVYADTGTINTSDERSKTWRGPMTDAELRAARRIIAELGFFQLNDAIAEKGADGARYHFGPRAQRAFAIMAEEGLDWGRYAWCCYDAWPAEPAQHDGDGRVIVQAKDGGDRYGVRTDQLALFLIAAQEQRLAALEARAA